MTKPRTCDKPTVALSAEKLGFEFSQKKTQYEQNTKGVSSCQLLCNI